VRSLAIAICGLLTIGEWLLRFPMPVLPA
jgi:hypothetical protein